MARGADIKAGKQRKLPLLGVAGALMLALPTASLAVVGFSPSAAVSDDAFGIFTPSSVDPDLAARVADKAREKGIRFTPAGSNPVLRNKTVTVAVRVDNETASAVSVRSAIDAAPGAGKSLAALQSSRFNLGTARGYQSFARQVELPSNVRNLSLPDLTEFEPAKPRAVTKPSRLQPRIELEDEAIAGRSPNTLDALGSQTVDVGGSFSLSPNLDVTAGVRYSQERERLDPLTNSVQDSQAVYVGTQLKF
ncbi:hypothetical protein FGU71_04765 [Erythrobacter insulae]|uniref:Uncharacterized protein n=1 Tax=Erythrobacter insulae TaxID=2584124 RepID=A0A547PAS1_9SPHN|nr:hypothetical protein [Erythrobacter insulae]TRD11230.1 hypothetical protein FGU71_04765 [Erythrobacter insulae]